MSTQTQPTAQAHSPEQIRHNRRLGMMACLGTLIDVVLVTGGAFMVLTLLPVFVKLASEKSESVPYMLWMVPMGVAGVIAGLSVAISASDRSRRITKAALAVFLLSILPPLYLGYFLTPIVAEAFALLMPVLFWFMIWATVSFGLLKTEESLGKRTKGWDRRRTEVWTRSRKAFRLIATPVIGAATATAMVGLFMIVGNTAEQFCSLTWPTTEATVIKCEIADDCSDWNYLLDLEYEFLVDGKTYTGDRETSWRKSGFAWSNHAAERSSELNESGTATVSYHPDDPGRSMLSPGMNGDLAVIVLAALMTPGIAFLGLTILFVQNRRLMDRKATFRDSRPAWLVVNVFTLIGFITTILYFLILHTSTFGWALVFVLTIAFTYVIGIRLIASSERQRIKQLGKGKFVVFGNQPEPV